MSAAPDLVADAAPEIAPEIAATVAETVELLRADVRLVALRLSDVERRAVALEAIVERMVDADTKVVWIGNPLRSPLTIERVFLQAVGVDADLRFERSPAELALMLARSAGDFPRLLLILQQPETLDAEARETIGALAPHLPAAQPLVQFLFSGTDVFTLPFPPVSPDRVAFIPPPDAETPSGRRWEPVPLLLLLGVVLIGAGMPLQVSDRAPPPTVAAVPLPEITVPLTAVPPTIDVAALRREFEAFLNQRPSSIIPLTDRQKDALFDEFIERRRHRPSSAAM